MATSQGVRRLSLFAGTLGAMVFSASALTSQGLFKDWPPFGLIELAVVSILGFVLPWGFVRMAARVVEWAASPAEAPRGAKSNSFLTFVWPNIVDVKSAHAASRQGFVAAVFISTLTAVFSLSSAVQGPSIDGIDIWAMVDAALFGVIALGIYKHSRLSSVSGLALYLVERVYVWMQPGPKNPVIAVLFTLAFTNGIRGCFARHRLLSALARSSFIRAENHEGGPDEAVPPAP